MFGVATNSMHAMLRDLNHPPHFWAEVRMIFMYLCNRTLMRVNNGITPNESFYRMKLDEGYIHTFGCIMGVLCMLHYLARHCHWQCWC